MQAGDGSLPRNHVAKGDAAVIGARLHHHRALSPSGSHTGLGNRHEQTVICIVNVAHFGMGQRIIVHSAARLTVRDGHIQAQRSLIIQLQAKRRIIDDGFAAKRIGREPLGPHPRAAREVVDQLAASVFSQ